MNPTLDGMNLVAKEALYLGERAPLLLSVNAGAYEQLAGHVTPIEPFDVESTAADHARGDERRRGIRRAAEPAVNCCAARPPPAGWPS